MQKNSVQSVGKKWFFALMIFLWGCVVLCGYIVFSIININKYNDLSNQIDKILISSQKCTVVAKEFLMNAYTDETYVKTGTNESFEAFNRGMDTVFTLTQSFEKSEYINTDDKKEAIQDLDSSLNSYKLGFYQIADLFKQKGFKDLGLEGEMRNAIHFIENHEAPIDLEYLLMLRRHEKDFLLRKDNKYVEKFDQDIVKFENHIKFNNSIYPEFQRQDILEALEKYRITFDKIVVIEKQIGLTANEGHRSKFTQTLAKIENILSNFNSKIKEEKTKASYAINIIIGAIIVIFVLIISGVFFSVNYLNKAVIKPIEKLNEAADQIAEGNLSVNLDGMKKQALMRELVISYEKLIEKLRSTITHIELITSRKISTSFDLKNDDDEIGKSLNRIISELQTIDLEEKQRIWITEGLATFGDIIRSNTDLNLLSNSVITFLVKYLKANQGGLYILKVDGDRDVLKLEAAYAYERKKFLNRTIEVGEGLVGQCYKEKDLIYMTDIPDEYMTITSGLGDANPRALLVAPMICNEKVEAVVELASFKNFEPYQMEFISKIGEILASSITNVKTTELTSKLLEDSKLQSEQRRAQEEELRQNLEEMMATQEEIARKEVDYKSEIIELKSENDTFKQKLEILNKETTSLQFLLKAKEIELKKLQEQHNFRDEIKRPELQRYPRRIEHFLDS
ncbi:MAG: GAF domain-containing protein [Cytophagales bacterium]